MEEGGREGGQTGYTKLFIFSPFPTLDSFSQTSSHRQWKTEQEENIPTPGSLDNNDLTLVLFSFPCTSLDPGLEVAFEVGDIGPARSMCTNDKLQQTFVPWPPIDVLAFRAPTSQPVILAYLGILAVIFQFSGNFLIV